MAAGWNGTACASLPGAHAGFRSMLHILPQLPEGGMGAGTTLRTGGVLFR
jgi:hypothetical protein